MRPEMRDDQAAFWQSYSQIYPWIEKARPHQKLKETVLSALDPQPGEVILDAGCGSGAMLAGVWEHTAGQIGQLVGLDFDSTMVEHASRRARGFSPQPVNGQVKVWQQTLGGRLPFAAETFDGIVANLVLPYVTSFAGRAGLVALVGVLGELGRLLKRGSRLVWSTPVAGVWFGWVFLASAGDMFHPRVLRDPVERQRFRYALAIMRHAWQIEQMGRQGIYTFLHREALEPLLVGIGYTNISIQRSFARQAWVIRCEKPANVL